MPRDTLKLKKKFSYSNQGSMAVNKYLNQFIQLSSYAIDDVNTDEKQDMFLKDRIKQLEGVNVSQSKNFE
jgi:hypothetical protein